ncbi:MAG: arginine decarboxylase, partial [Mailhella sp.]|nr:arginine decarboxylase [Mailhella sp.]
SYDFAREIDGDTVSDILAYVEYDPHRVLLGIRKSAERAVREGRITPAQRFKLMQAFENGLRGYTYYES